MGADGGGASGWGDGGGAGSSGDGGSDDDGGEGKGGDGGGAGVAGGGAEDGEGEELWKAVSVAALRGEERPEGEHALVERLQLLPRQQPVPVRAVLLLPVPRDEQPDAGTQESVPG